MAERGGGEHGSALLLFPAAVLILFLLGAIAVDAAVARLRQRELATTAQAAAQDAAAYAIDPNALRRGEWRLDPGRAAAAAVAAVAAAGTPVEGAPTVSVDGDVVTVTLRGRAESVFGVVVDDDGSTLRARATAVAPRR